MNSVMRRKLLLLVLFIISVSACGVLGSDSEVTPIYVTETPRILVITNTPTPQATAVLAPTAGGSAASTSVAANPTLGPPSWTPTTIITQTPTFTPTPTDTPVTPGANVLVPVGGVGAVGFEAGTCTGQASGGFASILNSDPALAAQISCPLGSAVTVQTAYQPFERGLMIWVSAVGNSGQSGIYVFYNNNTYQRFVDTWREGVDPDSSGQAPPNGRFEPVRGFGKVWRESGGVRENLGWALQQEAAGSGAVQLFERGEMVYITQTGQTYIAVAGTPGTWTAVSVAY